MKSRSELQKELEELLGTSNLPLEEKRVYFQPPSSVKLKYPCIIYNLTRTDVRSGDNKKYIKHNEYHIKHLFKSLKNELKDSILDRFNYITHDTRFVSDGIYNDDFTLYY